jgi:hypothetical protein
MPEGLGVCGDAGRDADGSAHMAAPYASRREDNTHNRDRTPIDKHWEAFLGGSDGLLGSVSPPPSCEVPSGGVGGSLGEEGDAGGEAGGGEDEGGPFWELLKAVEAAQLHTIKAAGALTRQSSATSHNLY